MIIKNHFHKKGFALGLVLKQRLVASRKWPIECVRTWTRNHICLLKQKIVFALKKSLTPIGLIYSSHMADSLLFTPPIWRT